MSQAGRQTSTSSGRHPHREFDQVAVVHFQASPIAKCPATNGVKDMRQGRTELEVGAVAQQSVERPTNAQVRAESEPIPDPAALKARIYTLLETLQPEHLKELKAFCAGQLWICGRLPGVAHELFLSEASDLLHQAFETLLANLQNPGKVNQPRPTDVMSVDTFIPYLRKTVRRLCQKQASSAARRAEVIKPPIHGIEPPGAAKSNPAEEVELRDLEQEFFRTIRLILHDAKKYDVALQAWREDFFSIDRLSQLGLNQMDTCILRLRAQWLYSLLSEPISAKVPFPSAYGARMTCKNPTII